MLIIGEKRVQPSKVICYQILVKFIQYFLFTYIQHIPNETTHGIKYYINCDFFPLKMIMSHDRSCDTAVVNEDLGCFANRDGKHQKSDQGVD